MSASGFADPSVMHLVESPNFRSVHTKSVLGCVLMLVVSRCRSTVSGQRQLALRALAGVLVNRAAYIQRGEFPPHPRLPQMLPIAIRYVFSQS